MINKEYYKINDNIYNLNTIKCNLNEKIEFEIKLLFSILSNKEKKDILIKYYEYFQKYGNAIETKTINFITNKNFIKQIKYTDTDNIKLFYKKEKIHQPEYFYFKNDIIYNNKSNVFPLFKTTINKESIIEKFNDTNIDYSLIRMRRRFSWIYLDWQIDLTFIKQFPIKTSTQLLKEEKQKLFIGDINYLFTLEQIELEFEYINNDFTKLNIYDILDFIPKIELINDSILYLDAINFIKELFPEKIPFKSNRELSIKQLLPQTIELSKILYYSEILSNLDLYYLTDKIDGERVLLFLQEYSGWITSDNKFHLINKNKDFINFKIILDCEKINNIFYVFDILYYEYDNTILNLYKCPFTLRLEFLQINIKSWHVFLNSDILLKLKIFKLLNSNKIKDAIEYFQSNNLEYKKDGLIFSSGLQSYQETKYFKWKPIEYMSIDFIVKKCPNELLGIMPYIQKPNKILYLLFVGIRQNEYYAFNMRKINKYNLLFNINRTDYFPIQFSPSSDEYAYLFWSELTTLDNEIVELIRINNEWQLLKIRSDRKQDYLNEQYFGNNFKIAELIWYNYNNPLLIKDLYTTKCELQSEFYFKNSQESDLSKKHKSIRKYNNFVKTKLLERITKNQKWVIDIGAGRGQDFLKYINNKIENILFIDSNLNNINEIINRKYIYIKQNMHINIRTICEDITKLSEKYINIYELKKNELEYNFKNKIELKYKYNEINSDIFSELLNLPKNIEIETIVCNFAIHYMIWDKKSINNFCYLLSNIVKKNGRILITCLDGELLFDRILRQNKLNLENKFLENKYGDGNRYLFIKKNEDNIFTGINQKIDVKLPFSDEFYTEYLVNINLLINTFKKYKLDIEIEGYFSDFQKSYNTYINENKHLSNYKLDLWDIKYSELIRYLIFYKK
jgi:hypothetical protein